jgi:hypothetical protein
MGLWKSGAGAAFLCREEFNLARRWTAERSIDERRCPPSAVNSASVATRPSLKPVLKMLRSSIINLVHRGRGNVVVNR